jgi:hypothetical protein
MPPGKLPHRADVTGMKPKGDCSYSGLIPLPRPAPVLGCGSFGLGINDGRDR